MCAGIVERRRCCLAVDSGTRRGVAGNTAETMDGSGGEPKESQQGNKGVEDITAETMYGSGGEPKE
jgi:hypothetical protein